MKSKVLVTAALLAGVFVAGGCATQDELRHVSRSLDTKITTVQDTVSGFQESLEKEIESRREIEDAIKSVRKNQANVNADIIQLRDELQRVRGALEEVQARALQEGAGSLDPETGDIRELLKDTEARIQSLEAELGTARDRPRAEKKTSASAPEKPPDSETLYSEAYGLFKEGKYGDSRDKFRKFLEMFPETEYSDNAQFWIGESFYFEGEYEKAILEYQKVIQDYSQGSRVPNSLLKQALSFEKLGDTSSARLLLQRVVSDFPGTTAAESARSKLLELQ